MKLTLLIVSSERLSDLKHGDKQAIEVGAIMNEVNEALTASGITGPGF